MWSLYSSCKLQHTAKEGILLYLMTSLWGNAGAYRGATNRLLQTLPWDAILPCHGDYIESGGKQTLAKHLGLKT